MLSRTEMTQRILNKLVELVPEPSPQVQAAYQAAIDFFGEEAVDLQHYSLLRPLQDDILEGEVASLSLAEFGVSVEQLAIEEYITADATLLRVFEEYSGTFETFLNALSNVFIKSSSLPLWQILVRLDHITVSNEQDVSTQIEEIYSLTALTHTGKCYGKMYWARTKASQAHFLSKYRHSHLPSSYATGADYAAWLHPCLGTGPINMTINSLQENFSEDLWSLYWLEMDQCIRVESLSGGPYYKITDINTSRNVCSTIRSYDVQTKTLTEVTDMIYRTFKALISSDKIRWKVRRNHLEVANALEDFTQIVSNEYLDQIGKEYPDEESARAIMQHQLGIGILYYGQITPTGKLERLSLSMSAEKSSYPLGWKFKGEPVSLVVQGSEFRPLVLLSNKSVSCIHNYLTVLANVSYERKTK